MEPGQTLVGKARMAHARPAKARTEADRAVLEEYGKNRRPPRAVNEEDGGVAYASGPGWCQARRHLLEDGAPIRHVPGVGWSCVADAEGRL